MATVDNGQNSPFDKDILGMTATDSKKKIALSIMVPLGTAGLVSGLINWDSNSNPPPRAILTGGPSPDSSGSGKISKVKPESPEKQLGQSAQKQAETAPAPREKKEAQQPKTHNHKRNYIGRIADKSKRRKNIPIGIKPTIDEKFIIKEYFEAPENHTMPTPEENTDNDKSGEAWVDLSGEPNSTKDEWIFIKD